MLQHVTFTYRVVVTIIMNNKWERGETTCDVHESRGEMPGEEQCTTLNSN